MTFPDSTVERPARVLRGVKVEPTAEAGAMRILRGASALDVLGLDDLHDFTAPGAGKPSAPEQVPEPPEPEKSLDEWRSEWEAEWQQRHEQDVLRARSEAYQEGYEAARTEMAAELAELQGAIAEIGLHLQAAWDEALETLKPQLTELAASFAEALLDEALPEDVRGVSGQALAQALDRLGAQAPIEVTLHPTDLMRLKEEGWLDQLGAVTPQLRWHPDPACTPGDWTAQTSRAAIRWLREEQVRLLRQHLGLKDVERETSNGERET